MFPIEVEYSTRISVLVMLKVEKAGANTFWILHKNVCPSDMYYE